MAYDVTIYFVGPTTVWTGTVQPEDIISHRVMPWCWLACSWARSARRYLDNHCGITVRAGDRVVLQLDPPCKVRQ